MASRTTLEVLAQLVQGIIKGDAHTSIEKVAPVHTAQAGDLTFVLEKKFLSLANQSKASALLLKSGWPTTKPCIYVDNPRAVLPKVLAGFDMRPVPTPGVSAKAFIHPTATLGNSVSIQPFAYIGEHAVLHDNVVIHPYVHVGANSTIGSGSVLYAHVVVYDQVVIGENVIIHAGTIIGTDGFGFFENERKEQVKIPQIGTVIIEDDVEIGSLTTIDRATLGATVIHRGAKLDDQIHVAHNCEIGENAAIAACVGMAGSTTIGKNVNIAGEVAIAGHLTIGDNVTILGKAGVTKNIPAGSVVSGFPARDHREELAFQAALRQLVKSSR